jgi:hypothetical protein
MVEHDPVSIERLRILIGYRKGARSLLAYLRAVERARSCSVVLDVPGPKLTRYLVTLGSVREHAPELLPRDQVTQRRVGRGGDQEGARQLLLDLEERVGEIVADVCERRVGQRLTSVERRLRTLESATGQR